MKGVNWYTATLSRTRVSRKGVKSKEHKVQSHQNRWAHPNRSVCESNMCNCLAQKQVTDTSFPGALPGEANTTHWHLHSLRHKGGVG